MRMLNGTLRSTCSAAQYDIRYVYQDIKLGDDREPNPC